MSNNATCSTINDMDIDVASNVTDDVAANVASYVAGDDDVYMSMMWKVHVNDVESATDVANDVAGDISTPTHFWMDPILRGPQTWAKYFSTRN